MDARPAGFWIRLLACLIDTLCLLIPILPIIAMSTLLDAPLLLTVGLEVASIAYFTFFQAGNWQATPGKRLLKLRVVQAGNHETLTLAGSFTRYMVLAGALNILIEIGSHSGEAATMLVLLAGALYYLVLVVMLVNSPEKAGLHDVLCKTRVLHGLSPHGVKKKDSI